MIQARQIEVFQSVMQAGTMTNAADLLHITQPAVSRIIRDLERTVGFALFNRRGNLISPTAEAHLLFGAVKRSFQGLRAIAQYAENIRHGSVGALRLAVLPAMAAGFLPRFVARYAADRPDLHFELEGLPSPQALEAVAGGTFDLGVVSIPFVQQTLVATPFQDVTVVVMVAGHALAARHEIRARDLQGERLYVLSKFLDGRHPIQAELASAALDGMVGVSHSSMAAAMALETGAVALIDPFTADEFARQGAIIRPFQPRIAVGTGLVRPRDRPLSAVAADFHDAFVLHVESFLARLQNRRSRRGEHSK